MMKLKAKGKDGKDLLGFGLSDGNIDKLKAGQAIYIEGEQLDVGVNVLLFYGKTEQEMLKTLRGMGVKVEHEVVDMKIFKKDPKPE